MSNKVRLDLLLLQKGLCATRERAKTTIMSGYVYVNGQKQEKPGQEFAPDCDISVRNDPIGFVSRGGLKLEKALDYFHVDVSGLNVLDCGASTGGFTDCLLKRGAIHVWAIDVGYGQLAWTLRNDNRVTCWERTNFRYVLPEQLGIRADMAVMDLSFISLKLVLPVAKSLLVDNGKVICLIKPQFEAGRNMVGKNGVIKDAAVHKLVLKSFTHSALDCGFSVLGMTYSPIKGPKGNIEFLAYLESSMVPEYSCVDWEKMVDDAHLALRGDSVNE